MDFWSAGLLNLSGGFAANTPEGCSPWVAGPPPEGGPALISKDLPVLKATECRALQFNRDTVSHTNAKEHVPGVGMTNKFPDMDPFSRSNTGFHNESEWPKTYQEWGFAAFR